MEWTSTIPLREKRQSLELHIEGNVLPAWIAQGTDTYWYAWAWVGENAASVVWAWGTSERQAAEDLAEKLVGHIRS